MPPPRLGMACVLLLACIQLSAGHSSRLLQQALRVLHMDGGASTEEQQQPHDAGWNSLFHHQPLTQHHGGYRFMLHKHQRQRGITHYGSAERLRAALSRAVTKKQLTVAVVGGSISAGTGAEDAPSWVDRLQAYLTETYGRIAGVNVTLNNGAVPGTTSAYMSACVNLHVPPSADVVFVEYSVNDENRAYPLMDNPVRRPMERLLRKLLAMPNAPAVVLLHAYAWLRPDPVEGSFYSNAEAELEEFARYYGLQSVSVKGCCYEAMRKALPGFQVTAPRESNMLDLKGLAFYYDAIHPDGNTGHRVMAELAVTLLQRGVADILHSPLSHHEAAYLREPLPPPLVAGNYESLADKCFVGTSFKDKAVIGRPAAWEWVNESHGPRPKWGYVATKPGSLLTFMVNTTASSGNRSHPVLVQLAYLASYEHMGKAQVRCQSGCDCDDSVLDGHHSTHSSLLKLHGVYTSQHDECVMAVQVLEDSESPGKEHKVKLAAVVVSEEAGEDAAGVDNPAAVEHVHDISFRHVGFGAGGVFDIRNHI